MVRQLCLTLGRLLPRVLHGALIASTKRRDTTYQFFLDQLSLQQLVVEDLAVAEDLGGRFFCQPEAPIALIRVFAKSLIP